MTLADLRTQRWLRPAWLMLLGYLQALALAWPGSGQASGMLQCVVAALWLQGVWVRKHDWRAVGQTTFWYVCAWLLGSFWWLHISMHQYGGLPAALSILALVLLAAALALYYVGMMAVWAFLLSRRNPQNPWWGALSLAAAWTLAELMRGQWLTGFPWGAVGYAHVDSWLSAWAPWLGVYGVGAVAWFLVALWVQRRESKGVWRGIALVLVATGLLGQINDRWTQSAGHQTVTLLQGNIEQDQKFLAQGGVIDALRWYGQQLRASTSSLVVTPETALPLLEQSLPQGYSQALSEAFPEGGPRAALVGVAVQDQGSYRNSLRGWGAQAPYRYDKHHLVPFGEFVPPLFAWFVAQMNIPFGQFGRGPVDALSFHWQGQRIAPNICYEDVFGEDLAQRFRQEDLAPTVMVNASNIAWFGNTVAVPQHLNISRMRALEFQRPMLRATNTGATAIIDHLGRVKQQLPAYQRSVLEGEFEGRQGLTPYARMASLWGLWPLWLFSLGVLTLGLRRRRPLARA
ncbi:MAG: hypothetical protein RLZ63_1277 [Pseudomonadota bacterium]|jgi:apolipoprotein N-acyltransferase